MARAVRSQYVYNKNGQLTAQSYTPVTAGTGEAALPQAQHYYDTYGRYHYSAYARSPSAAGQLYRSTEYDTNNLSGKPQQTTRPKKLSLRYGVQNQALAADDQYLYEYDALGNIRKIRWLRNGSLAETMVYSYDALGQLLSARIQSASGAVLHEELFTYAYDQSEGYQGNIAVVNRNGNAYEYEYSTGWSDQLLRVKDSAGNLLRSYTYDAIGNPTSDGSRGYEWSCGRLLTKVSAGSTTVATYTYDGGGERIGKTAGGVSHEYWQEDGRILSEKLSGGKSATLNYYYGQDGLEYIVHNGAQYWALKNLQGDIVGLAQIQANGAGTLVCRYRYSAFGELLSVTDAGGSTITDTNHIAHLNPFRYRGYYYDAETGFYATGTRYYDPFIGRFLNADDTDVMLEHLEESPLSKNLYTYCLNNPVNYADPYGDFALALAGGGSLTAGAALGGANFWNPVGWVVLGITAVGAIGYIGYNVHLRSKSGKPAKKKTSKKSGKEKASDAPDWAKRQKYNPNQSADKNAREVLDQKYGKGNYKTGPGSEFSEIKKWLQRSKGYK